MKRKLIKALYGNIVLNKQYYEKCKSYAIVINNILQCCDREAEVIEEFIKKRICSPEQSRKQLTQKIKKAILEEQNNKCIYCEIDLFSWYWDANKEKYRKVKIHYDHFIPFIYNQNNHKNNIIATCSQCNLVKHSKVFDSLEQAQIYILTERKIIK